MFNDCIVSKCMYCACMYVHVCIIIYIYILFTPLSIIFIILQSIENKKKHQTSLHLTSIKKQIKELWHSIFLINHVPTIFTKAQFS